MLIGSCPFFRCHQVGELSICYHFAGDILITTCFHFIFPFHYILYRYRAEFSWPVYIAISRCLCRREEFPCRLLTAFSSLPLGPYVTAHPVVANHREEIKVRPICTVGTQDKQSSINDWRLSSSTPMPGIWVRVHVRRTRYINMFILFLNHKQFFVKVMHIYNVSAYLKRFPCY